MRWMLIAGIVLVGALAGFAYIGEKSGTLLPEGEPSLSVSAAPNGVSTPVTVVSHEKQPISVNRVVINDRNGVYGCDFQSSMNGKGDNAPVSDFSRTVLREGEEAVVTVWAACGDRVVKVSVETDRGQADFDIR